MYQSAISCRAGDRATHITEKQCVCHVGLKHPKCENETGKKP